MMMTLKRWISYLRERIRAFLGLDLMPSRLEIIEIRQLIEENHRATLEALLKLKIQPQMLEITQFQPSDLTWEQVEKIHLIELLSQKES